MKVGPFFSFYGGKNRAGRHYPAPEHDTIIEPFAGGAGYACNYPDRRVLLRDADPVIVETWRYLLATSGEDIAALPDIEPGQSVDELDELEPGARHLIGWWLNAGTTSPCKRPSAWMRQGGHPGSFWGARVRDRIAAQVEHVRHWTVELGDYADAPDVEATWFIDPPYLRAGYKYRFGSRRIDYAHLAAWCKARQGQVVVCEADDADWLPFRPLVPIKGTPGSHKRTRARMEVIWP